MTRLALARTAASRSRGIRSLAVVAALEGIRGHDQAAGEQQRQDEHRVRYSQDHQPEAADVWDLGEGWGLEEEKPGGARRRREELRPPQIGASRRS